MSDDRVWLHRVGAGLIDDPCSYKCWAKGCEQSTGYQPDKTATGMRRLTERESRALNEIWRDQRVLTGQYTCPVHAPHTCRGCGGVIPWFDGSMCDLCDRYADEDGGYDNE